MDSRRPRRVPKLVMPRPHRPKAHPPEGEEIRRRSLRCRRICVGPRRTRKKPPGMIESSHISWRRFLREHDRMDADAGRGIHGRGASAAPARADGSPRRKPTRPEDADEAERHAVRPPRPEGRREDHAEMRPHHAEPGPEETGSRPATPWSAALAAVRRARHQPRWHHLGGGNRQCVGEFERPAQKRPATISRATTCARRTARRSAER